MEITWTGILSASAFVGLSMEIVYLLMTRSAIYQPKTKVFFWTYAAFLLLRAYTLLSAPVTPVSIIGTIATVALFCPIVLMMTSVMKVSDPWKVTDIIQGLKNQLQVRADHEKKLLEENPVLKTQAELEQRLEISDRRIDQLLERFKVVLKP